MKTFLCSLILCFYFYTDTKAQITLDSSLSEWVNIIKLEKSGYKYMDIEYSYDTMYLYNLDFSLFKKMALPAPGSGGYRVEYITETLFDTDSNTVEYAIETSPTGWLKIMNEAGTVLLDVPGGRFPWGSQPSVLMNQTYYPVTNTPQGAKMRVAVGAQMYIYTLPGYLECSTCYSPILSQNANGNVNRSTISLSQSYPNPAFQFTVIDYVLPENVNEGIIVLYDANGREIKRYNVNSKSSHVNISTSELSSGTYYYSLVTKSGMAADRKMLVIH